ncbi:bifunctional metallophosphatase/5'-nucleotidase [Aquibacillus salsiterrae]|uniref:Bifunctional metallophosphatase/5'-nucleotidase n=1 Tax=Aquibacillus salsiterrae TaxID=2950439 RepID=A0A9X4AH22_9BACI|nr:bifunctional UDP-sugar hydrolase/5'-nucleotidase [Aquibacillus salsiterrae]MDC3417880.1 bifunctional metallophosphatase/5'-nucleotidase [Aquibacillus salsiterrae]
MKEKMFFYYTNDLHSHFENWTKIVSYFEKQKNIRKRGNESYWLLDIGDHIDRSHPITEAMMGKANVQLLNHAEYNLATIGNNEGITLDYNDLFHLYDEANFEIVCANLESTKGQNPAWLKTSTQFISPSGLRIGLFGLTAPFNAFYNLLGWHINSPNEAIDSVLSDLRHDNDIVVLLSHLGINEDEEIARQYPSIDVIIGGHTHHLFKDGEYIENTLLTAAGKHGLHVGEVILTWDHEQKKLIEKEAYAINIDHQVEHAETKKHLEHLDENACQTLDQTIIYLENKLEVNWFDETYLMNKLTETLQEWTKADCAMLNAGVLLNSLGPGKVTSRDVHRICPHPINPCLVELTGHEILEVIRVSYTKAFMELELKGFGFRGKMIGKMIFSNIDVLAKQRQSGEFQVIDVKINGEPLSLDKVYKVATADTFTFGPLLPEIARSNFKEYFMPEFLRDLLIHTLKTKI